MSKMPYGIYATHAIMTANPCAGPKSKSKSCDCKRCGTYARKSKPRKKKNNRKSNFVFLFTFLDILQPPTNELYVEIYLAFGA